MMMANIGDCFSFEQLSSRLLAIDGRGYKAYRSIAGCYESPSYCLLIDHVQGDPFAEPSRVRVCLSAETAGLPTWATSSSVQRTATSDYLNRVQAIMLRKYSRHVGTGKGGLLEMLVPGQQVLVRSSVLVSVDGTIESRFKVGLPAAGRRVLGRVADVLFREQVRDAIESSLFKDAIDFSELQQFVETHEDSVALRGQLKARGLVAFVADGSVLPRSSGIDDRPLQGENVVSFESPHTLSIELESPHSGRVRGMGIPRGVTLIVGGGYHGKSTLLRALESGVYDHIPGDGRERVVALTDCVKVRAEDGRSVAGTDISNFIEGLPGGESTNHFETSNASGSTSQAAFISEAIEVGAQCLLLDEDTSATNFMIRDARMQQLIASEFEPITPFVDRVCQLYNDLSVSSVLVIGGTGDYLDVADCVIGMKAYRAFDLTENAQEIVEASPSSRDRIDAEWMQLSTRYPEPMSLDPANRRRSVSIKMRGENVLEFGRVQVDVSALEQLVEPGQLRAIGWAMVTLRRLLESDDSLSMREALACVTNLIATGGLDEIHSDVHGGLAAFRIYEFSGVVSRLRGLKTRTISSES